jgi:transcriptional regulator
VYTPRPFRPDDATVRSIIEELPVGQLVTATETGPLATLVPWVADLDGGALLGHVARSNPQWSTPWHGQAMVLIEGPSGYVSPSWYASKSEHGRVVPTWDFVVVQVLGDLIVHDNATWVRSVVDRLTDRHERSRPKPWSITDAPPDYLDSQLAAIVGVEVRIARIEASVKMSQNKGAADVEGVISGFLADGDTTMADWIRRSNRS